MHLKEEIATKMATNEEEKVLFRQDYALSQVDRNNGKTTWIALWIASAYSPDLALCDYWQNSRKRFGSNEEVISETEAYFAGKDKSFY